SRNLALLDALGAKGCKTCIILSAPTSQHEELLACARHYKMRLPADSDHLLVMHGSHVAVPGS
ncbi:hypothetical protein MJI15_19650, partial [Salmonella enterica subsp. enterica serovar Cerro]|nr:hypothetical protein [Salmonella enterica subsp. enterica serovar Cerro]